MNPRGHRRAAHCPWRLRPAASPDWSIGTGPRVNAGARALGGLAQSAECPSGEALRRRRRASCGRFKPWSLGYLALRVRGRRML